MTARRAARGSKRTNSVKFSLRGFFYPRRQTQRRVADRVRLSSVRHPRHEARSRSPSAWRATHRPMAPVPRARHARGRPRHAFPKWAANRKFRGDDLTDAIGSCASVAVVQQFGSYRRQSTSARSSFLPTQAAMTARRAARGSKRTNSVKFSLRGFFYPRRQTQRRVADRVRLSSVRHPRHEARSRSPSAWRATHRPMAPVPRARHARGRPRHAFPKWAANRKFRGDDLTDAIGSCASVAVVQQFGSYRRQSGHAVDIAESTRLTRSATSLPNLLRCTRLQ